MATKSRKTGTSRKPSAARKRPRKPSAREAITAPLRRATAAMKKDWEKTERVIVRLRGAGAQAFDELYETVYAVMTSDPPVYLGGGMRTAREFIERMLPGEDERSVSRNVLVAIAFTPRDEQTKGIGFLEEVAQYVMELSGSKALPRAIDLDRLRIPVRRADGDIVHTPARQASREDVRAARNALGKKRKRPAAPALKPILGALSMRKALRSVKVHATGTEASFSGVPLSDLAAFGALLAKIKLPDETK